MKALSLWQPWASLVAMDAKRVETRHWAPSRSLIGERIAIHATLTRDHLHLCERSPFDRYLHSDQLPLGAVVATAVLDRCERITPELARALTPDEVAFGDYTPGRYAWFLRDVAGVSPPRSLRGAQGIFTVPDELLGLTPGRGQAQGTLL